MTTDPEFLISDLHLDGRSVLVVERIVARV
jgi:hypothetical protein